MEYKNSNICELVAKKLGYPKRVVVAKKNDSKQIDLDKNKFNLSEWYGFTSDNGKIIRLNVNQTPAKNGNYNFYPKEKVFDEESGQYIVVKKEQKIYYLKIDVKCCKPITYKISEIESWCSVALDLKKLSMISRVNEHFERIQQRADDDDDVDHLAIEKLIQESESKCFYCGITRDQINKLDSSEKNNQVGDKIFEKFNSLPGLTKREKRKTLEIDQLNPNGGYKEGNIVWACSWCNNAKTDTFTCEEFKEIAKGITQVWNQRFRKFNIDEEVINPCTIQAQKCI